MFPLGVPTLLDLDTEFKRKRGRIFVFRERKPRSVAEREQKLKLKIATPEIEPRTVACKGAHSTPMSPLNLFTMSPT